MYSNILGTDKSGKIFYYEVVRKIITTVYETLIANSVVTNNAPGWKLEQRILKFNALLCISGVLFLSLHNYQLINSLLNSSYGGAFKVKNLANYIVFCLLKKRYPSKVRVKKKAKGSVLKFSLTVLSHCCSLLLRTVSRNSTNACLHCDASSLFFTSPLQRKWFL